MWGWIRSLTHTSCETLGQLTDLSEPQVSSSVKKKLVISTSQSWMNHRWTTVTQIRHLAQGQAQSKCSILVAIICFCLLPYYTISNLWIPCLVNFCIPCSTKHNALHIREVLQNHIFSNWVVIMLQSKTFNISSPVFKFCLPILTTWP